MSERPLCFVLMPFGRKRDPSGGPDIDFDRIYDAAIRPGIEEAEMDSIRADTVFTGGIIHRQMVERLLLCDFAVADLTTADANVFYELGVRHAVRPATTLTIFASHRKPLFELSNQWGLPYELARGNSFGSREASMLRTMLARRLKQIRSSAHDKSLSDSPVFNLLDDYNPPDIERLKTNVFLQEARNSAELKRKIADARDRRDLYALTRIEEQLGALEAVEEGVLVELFSSFRALGAWERMVQLHGRMPADLKRSVSVREQLALALNRAKRPREALKILEDVLDEHGPSSETYGLMGRVYKDLWVEASRGSEETLAMGYLDQAISAYVRGFESDWRDVYPGINAVTLLNIKGDDRSLKLMSEMLPVIRFALMQRLKLVRPDYWDYATMLELAVLEGNEGGALQYLSNTLASIRVEWEPKTTANNLRIIRDARRKRGTEEPWLDAIIEQLERART